MIEEIEKVFNDSKTNLFKPEGDYCKPEEDFYKPIRIGNAFSTSYIEYKSNGDKD